MKTQYYTAVSLDGFIADPENNLDWLLQFGDPEEDSFSDFTRQVGAVAMGSTTYEWVLEHLDGPWPYEQPAWVFTSRELLPVPGADIRFARGDVRPVHREMVEVAAGKNVWLLGGGELVGQFHDHGLLDEVIVSIAPVTLGAGAPLLPRAITSPPLRLVSARTWGDAFVEARYELPRPGEASAATRIAG